MVLNEWKNGLITRMWEFNSTLAWLLFACLWNVVMKASCSSVTELPLHLLHVHWPTLSLMRKLWHSWTPQVGSLSALSQFRVPVQVQTTMSEFEFCNISFVWSAGFVGISCEMCQTCVKKKLNTGCLRWSSVMCTWLKKRVNELILEASE